MSSSSWDRIMRYCDYKFEYRNPPYADKAREHLRSDVFAINETAGEQLRDARRERDEAMGELDEARLKCDETTAEVERLLANAEQADQMLSNAVGHAKCDDGRISLARQILARRGLKPATDGEAAGKCEGLTANDRLILRGLKIMAGEL